MLKELRSLKDLLEEEYSACVEQISVKKKVYEEQKNSIREQEKFLLILEEERNKKREFLSAYNGDDLVTDRIKKETLKIEETKNILKQTESSLRELREKEEKYRKVLEDFYSVEDNNITFINCQVLEETDQLFDKLIKEYSSIFSTMDKNIEEYIYVDPDRVKIELQKYIKENKSLINQIKKIKKLMKDGLK